MEFRLGERWEVLDDLIPSTETEFIARDLVQVSPVGGIFLCENSRATCDRYFLCFFFLFFFLLQDSWYEFRVMAVMVDLISESSNVVGVSSTGWLPCNKCMKSWLPVSLSSPLAATARSLPTGGVA